MNKKIEDLLEQRYYHQLRTGIEHERAIVDIDRQIAEGRKTVAITAIRVGAARQKKRF
jgi:hypothetical protein